MIFRLHRKTAYRKLAFDNNPHKCDECGWKDFPDLLEVHHMNFNHDDDRLHNLQLLCPNCHRVTHYMAKADMVDFDLDPDWD